MNVFKKIDILYIVTLFFLLLSATANFLSFNNVAWFVILVFMLIVAASLKAMGVRELRYIAVFSAVYLGFVTIRDFWINSLDGNFFISDAIFLFKYILLAFVFVVILKGKALAYIVKVTVHLTVISFFFFFIQVIGFGNALYQFSQSLGLPNGVLLQGYANFVIFTITVGRHDLANSGFLWEPGAFGCFLSLTLMFNLFLNGFRFERKSIVLIIGILTTFSTTTYLALLIIFFLAYRVRVPKINKWFLLSIPALVLLFIGVPFLGTKIVTTYNEDMVDLTRMKFLEKFYHKQHSQIPLNRFASMTYIYDAFTNKLILGVGNNYNDILNKKNDVNISNGIFDYIAKFGVVGFIVLMVTYLKLCYRYLAKAELLVYCGVILLIVGFGEPVLHLPFILVFLFLPLVPVKKEKVGGEDESAEEDKEKSRTGKRRRKYVR